MICFSDLQFAMMGTAEEVIELISKGTFKAQQNGQKKKYERTNNDLQNIHIKLKID
jgi:hypothetical protein